MGMYPEINVYFDLTKGTQKFVGYTRYEEYDDPTLIYIDDGDVIYKGVEQDDE